MVKASTTQRGDWFEERIHAYFRALIDKDEFSAKASCCKLRRKPKYFSKDRNSDITFDLSIEIYMPGATQYSSVVLIECKNYSHPVPVDDAEEFFAKAQQVAPANGKPVIASASAFQSGVLNFARSKGMGLVRYLEEGLQKWELRRSPAAGSNGNQFDDARLLSAGLTDPNHHSDLFDIYFQSPSRSTVSLNDFFHDLLLAAGSSKAELRRIANPNARRSLAVPFLEREEIEKVAMSILDEYRPVACAPLEEICRAEKSRSGLTVHHDVPPSKAQIERQALGRITFDPPTIEIYRQDDPNPRRSRFTLAHELAHYFLGHGKHMKREFCEERDFSLERSPSVEGPEVARMEFQANFLAACLLLPKQSVIDDFHQQLAALGIRNRGFGALYVDRQPCNQQTLDLVLSYFCERYQVSATAARIRLKALGLVEDARDRMGLKHAHQSLRSF
jgi:Zn-dependent peptidase ImmA (M78 family)